MNKAPLIELFGTPIAYQAQTMPITSILPRIPSKVILIGAGIALITVAVVAYHYGKQAGKAEYYTYQPPRPAHEPVKG